MIEEFTLKLDNPITEEQWDAIEDVDFEHTYSIWFHTKHGHNVEFVKQKWIPVSERLPENDDEVLLTVEFKKHRFVYSGSYSKDVDGDSHWYSLWDEFRVGRAREKIIAWMPMPKPYEG